MEITVGSNSHSRRGRLNLYIIPALITGLIVMLLFVKKGYFIFGSESLACMDAQIQYVDFFSYLKNVLSGKDSILYTFNKGLGGSGIALFSYYLASPLNLLVAFFPVAYMTRFLDFLFAAKTMIAAVTFSIYLDKRFSGAIKPLYVVFLSVGYALTQYNVAQASNIMWLDGVYMLPLIMLAVYYLVKNSNILFLSITVGLSIIFNWYTGGINCLFAAFWFVAEFVYLNLGLFDIESLSVKEIARRFFGRLIPFILSMMLGVGISACLFLPTVLALREGKGAAFDLSGLKPRFLGNILTAAQNHTIGAKSALGSPALFSGSLVVIGFLCLFRSRLFSAKEKVFAGAIAGFSLSTLFVQTFYYMFSLLKPVWSYVYRFSYANSFSFCFLAAWYFSRYDGSDGERKKLLQNAAMFGFFLLVMDFVRHTWDLKYVYCTVFLMLAIAVCIYYRHSFKRFGNVIMTAGLCAAVFLEIVLNTNILMNNYHSSIVSKRYYEYSKAMSNLAKDIAAKDNSYYRIGQTIYRDNANNKISPYLNDGMAYSLKTNASYSSCNDNIQVELLNQLGYRSWSNTLNVVNTSIIPADSLLGVKYVASNYAINGLIPLTETIYDNKKIYENPYCLPMIYTVDSDSNNELTIDGNPFIYINGVYKAIFGENTEDIFEPVEFVSAEGNNEISYILDVKGNHIVYGNLPMPDTKNTKIYVDGDYWMDYAKWLASSVFYVPVSEGADKVEVKLVSENKLSPTDVQFYSVNTSVLEQIHKNVIDSNKAKDLVLENGYVSCTVSSEVPTNLQTSIMATNGWRAYVNGKPVKIQKTADSLIRIPLESGTSTVVLKFTVPGLYAGIIISIASFAIVLILQLLVIKAHRKGNKGK